MSNVLLSGVAAAPPPPPPTPGADATWIGLRPTWTGWDGSSWNLSDYSGGVFLVRGGTRGLTMPTMQRYTSTSPGVPGSRWRGRTTVEREVFWPVFVYSGSGSQAWVELDRAFWRSLSPDQPGTWSVTHPDGTTRSLRCRFADDGSHSFDMLPTITGWARYGITLVAEDPFWRGEPVTRTFGTTSSGSFFGTAGPPFTISSGSTLATATIPNPGDEQAWPVYRLNGPFTSATVGLNGRSVQVPFTLAAGKSLVIDTDPRAQTAIDSDGVERTGQLGTVDFTPVPPGSSVALGLSMVGTGSVEVTLQPAYWRAW